MRHANFTLHLADIRSKMEKRGIDWHQDTSHMDAICVLLDSIGKAKGAKPNDVLCEATQGSSGNPFAPA